VCVAALALVLIATGYLVWDHQRLAQENLSLRQEQQLNQARQQIMRDTIVAQDAEVVALGEEVQQLEFEWRGIADLVRQIRAIIGVPGPTPTPPPQPESKTPAPTASLTLTGLGGGPAPRPSAGYTHMRLAQEISTNLRELQQGLPSLLGDLTLLNTQLTVRMARINPAASDPESIERELRLLAAAPTRWPVDTPVRITSGFGWRSDIEEARLKEYHTGVDLAVNYYARVRATKDGVVRKAETVAGYGRTVVIAHDMGYSTLYGHNKVLLVKVGQEVKAGDVIALSGSSGRASGPHLHYEIRLNNKPLDPMIFLGLDGK